MHNMHILNGKEIRELKKKLEEQFGTLPALEFAFLRSQKDRVYVVNRELGELPTKGLRIDTVGMYFCEILPSGGIRLSVEGAQMIGKTATRNVIDLNADQMELWLRGDDVPLDTPYEPGFYILRFRDDIIGCGHAKNGVIANYMPKNRRIKEFNPTMAEETDDVEA